MWPFTRRKQKRAADEQWADVDTSTAEGQLLQAALTSESNLKIDQAMQIPAVAACVNKICDTVAMVPFYLYKTDEEMKVERVENDPRVALINVDPKDTLDAGQFKKAIVKDYLLDKGGYAYIDKVGNRVQSIRYVDPTYVSFNYSPDPIWKDYTILVNGKEYEPYQF